MGLFGNGMKQLIKEAQKRENEAQRNARDVNLRCPRCGAVKRARVVHSTDQFRCSCGYTLTPSDRY